METIKINNVDILVNEPRTVSFDLPLTERSGFTSCDRERCRWSNYCKSSTGEKVAKLRNVPKLHGLTMAMAGDSCCGMSAGFTNSLHHQFAGQDQNAHQASVDIMV